MRIGIHIRSEVWSYVRTVKRCKLQSKEKYFFWIFYFFLKLIPKQSNGSKKPRKQTELTVQTKWATKKINRHGQKRCKIFQLISLSDGQFCIFINIISITSSSAKLKKLKSRVEKGHWAKQKKMEDYSMRFWVSQQNVYVLKYVLLGHLIIFDTLNV